MLLETKIYRANNYNCDQVGSLHLGYSIVVSCFLVIAALFLTGNGESPAVDAVRGTQIILTTTTNPAWGEGAAYMRYGPPAPAPRHSPRPVPAIVQMKPLPTTRPTGDNTSPRRACPIIPISRKNDSTATRDFDPALLLSVGAFVKDGYVVEATGFLVK